VGLRLPIKKILEVQLHTGVPTTRYNFAAPIRGPLSFGGSAGLLPHRLQKAQTLLIN
jgi:hypothetical protein